MQQNVNKHNSQFINSKIEIPNSNLQIISKEKNAWEILKSIAFIQTDPETCSYPYFGNRK